MPEPAPEAGDAAARLAQFTREVAESLKLHRSATVRLSAAFLMAAAVACTPAQPAPSANAPSTPGVNESGTPLPTATPEPDSRFGRGWG